MVKASENGPWVRTTSLSHHLQCNLIVKQNFEDVTVLISFGEVESFA